MNSQTWNPTRTDRVITLITAIMSGYFTLFFLYAVFGNYWPGPFVDYWIDIPNIEKSFLGQLTLQDLISAHANVHRLFIPRLLFIADYHFFAGTNVLLVWVSIACKIITIALFNIVIQQQTWRTRLLVNTLLFAAIFNAANLSNVLHNSNMQWDLVSVFACLAIYFYCRDADISLGTRTRQISIAWAWLFFVCSFLSQAGALPVMFVFVFVSALHKKWLESSISLILTIAVLYLTFAVLPVNEPQNPTYENAVAMMLFKLKYVAIFVFKMFSGSIYPLDNKLFIFSWVMLAIFTASLLFARKTISVYHNFFLAIALFAFLMMVTIAAARVDFAPKTWAANRYQTNVMLFILAIGLHSYFTITKAIIKNILLAFLLASFIATQSFLHNYAVLFGNKVFDTQSYMLTHGANQYNGAGLLSSLQPTLDRIANADPLFQQHHLAWYANKRANTDTLQKHQSTFSEHCKKNSAAITYAPVPGGEGLMFSTMLETTIFSFLSAALPRNTYYVLDNNNVIIGYAYPFVDPEHIFKRAEIRGYVTAPTAHFIAEASDPGRPTCLYTLANPQ